MSNITRIKETACDILDLLVATDLDIESARASLGVAEKLLNLSSLRDGLNVAAVRRAVSDRSVMRLIYSKNDCNDNSCNGRQQ